MLENVSTTDFVGHFYQPRVGAATYATRRIKERLVEVVDEPSDELFERAERVLELLKIASSRRYDWDNLKRLEPLRRRGATDASHRLTTAISGLLRNIQTYEQFDEDTEEHRHATRLLESVLPQGVQPFTSARYEERYNKVKELLRRLRGPHADRVEYLNLGAFVERLDAVNREFGDHLSDQNAPGVTYDQVQSAESEATEAYFELILLVWAAYIDEPHLRNMILQPAEEQNQRIALHYRRQSRAPEVDPESGDIVGPDESVDPEEVDELDEFDEFDDLDEPDGVDDLEESAGVDGVDEIDEIDEPLDPAEPLEPAEPLADPAE